MSCMAGTIAGHPLDTIKVRMQLETRKLSARQITYETLPNEGVYGLWRGVTQPILGAVPINSIIFMTTQYTKDYLHS